MRYSSEIHKITKLENHEGKEITDEELVDKYYKDAGKYFEIDNNKAASPSTNEGAGTAATTSTAFAVSGTSLEPANPPEIKNNEIHDVSDEYSLDTQNRDKSQQISGSDMRSIRTKQ